MSLASHLLNHRLLWWVLDRTLPTHRQVSMPQPLLPIIRVALIGVGAGMAGGILFMLGCAALMVASYFYMLDQKIEPATACLLISIATFLICTTVFVVAQRMLTRRVEKLDAVLPPKPITVEEAITELPGVVIRNFIDGIIGDSPSKQPPRTH